MDLRCNQAACVSLRVIRVWPFGSATSFPSLERSRNRSPHSACFLLSAGSRSPRALSPSMNMLFSRYVPPVPPHPLFARPAPLFSDPSATHVNLGDERTHWNCRALNWVVWGKAVAFQTSGFYHESYINVPPGGL